MNILSLDCETNGLGGRAFAAAATLSDNSGELDRWQARCPIDGTVAPWVAENVLPALDDMQITRTSCDDLLAWWRFIYTHARARFPDLYVIGHVIWPVEATFLRDAHAEDLFKGPYPLLDVAPLLLAAGHDPTSVDTYLDTCGLAKPSGSPHHPLYDARATTTAFRHLIGDR